ncbi:class I SAM-dependent methyltransferase [Caldalkalibacillus mannanilyticus]|uniref:class I SAM-dependent methyltransferase n=1 Tax=Caldalkalibacillus mannanilyticus TaxID=1418 RepID=UPI000AFE6003|nr:class I SAM-dependent methyltransferase [Caldalkalibacillus mannanilyticus]
MNFYQELSKVYDQIFPPNPKAVHFLTRALNRTLKENSVILDAACGTGGYADLLAQEGFEVYGIDMDTGMIQKAKEKKTTAQFIQGNMIDGKKLFSKKFDLIYCIGNSLVHVQTKEEIRTLIRDWYEMLADDGVLVIQIVNFAHVMKNNNPSLPVIQRPEAGITFTRHYHFNDDQGSIDFSSELIMRNEYGKAEYTSHVTLLPIQMPELTHWIEEAGFSTIQMYGDYLQNKYDIDTSPALIIRTKKESNG